jgi:hypothetical protein
VLVAPRAILLPLDALGMQALVLVGEVVAVLAVVAGENDFLSRHSYLFRKEVIEDVEVVQVVEGTLDHLDHLDDLDHLI